MKEINSISIVCVCDNHYAILLATLIKSIESNHHTGEILEFFLVDDGISVKNKQKIIDSILPLNTILNWLPIEECLPNNTKLPIDKGSLPLSIYIRLFIPYFIPSRISKIIFLDVDMVMLEDISRLWNTDLGDNIVAAVQDQFIQIVSRWGGINNYKQLGIPAENKYFNAGLMIIDIPKWEAAGITDKVLDCIKNHKNSISFYDQYGLNAILYNRWYSLDPLWNRFAYSKEKKPYLIHFTGRKPIYKTYPFNENYRDIFYEYLKQTEWKNFKLIGETSRYFKKASNYLGKLKAFIY